MKPRLMWLPLLFLVHSASSAEGNPPRIDDEAETRFRVPLGTKQFRLVCPILPGEQNVMVEWSRNGEAMDYDSQYKFLRDNREVKLKNLKLDDSGRYECKVINGFGHKTVEFIIQIFDPATDVLSLRDRITTSNHTSAPMWLDEVEIAHSTSHPVRVNLGGKLELRCPAKANPLPVITWYKNDELIPPHGPIDSALLTIESAKAEDSGDYKCVIQNKLGQKNAVHKVKVADFFDATAEEAAGFLEHSLFPVIDTVNLTISAGRTANFTCKARLDNNPMHKVLIRWLKELTLSEKIRLERTSNATIMNANGKILMVIDGSERQIPGTEQIKGEGYFTNKLIIPNVGAGDAGRYICVVTNNEKIVYRTAELTVVGGLQIFDIQFGSFFYIAIPVIVFVLAFVVIGVCYLRSNVASTSRKKMQSMVQPPPPRIPPPAAPADMIYPQLTHATLHHSNFPVDKTHSPLLLRDSMFQNRLASTMDRIHTPHRLHRGVREDDMQHSPHFTHSPQPSPLYFGQKGGSSHQPLLTPHYIDSPTQRMLAHHHTMGHNGYIAAPSIGYSSSSNYRTLDINYCRDPHPSLYSEYTDNLPFLNTTRTHDL